MDISDVVTRLRSFSEDRDWEQYHTPRNLTLALVGEVGELAELFQWRTDDEILALTADPKTREPIADELADVFNYLVSLADALGIDLDAAVHHKITKNGEKYPPHLARGNNAKYTEFADLPTPGEAPPGA